MSPEYYTVGPGFAAFVVTFLLALSLWFLYRSFSKKLRKQRMEQRRREDAAANPTQASGGRSRVEKNDRGSDKVAGESRDS